MTIKQDWHYYHTPPYKKRHGMEKTISNYLNIKVVCRYCLFK
nr:MAG TPA: Protein of unknown function (DUF2754) [Caudoviricetes sp.]